MIVCYSLEEPGDATLRCLGGMAAPVVRDLEGLERVAGQSSCCVLVLPELQDSIHLDRVRTLMGNLRHVGWVLVTRCTPANVVTVGQCTGVAEVVWLEEADEVLRSAVLRAVEADPVAWFAKSMDAANLPAELRQGFAKACCLPCPPRTVLGLCRAAALKETRLRYLWSQYIPTNSATPKDLVEWLQVVWAFRLRRHAGSWTEVARLLQIRENTLREVIKRRTGMCPAAIWNKGPRLLRAQITEWWFRVDTGLRAGRPGLFSKVAGSILERRRGDRNLPVQ